MVEFLLNEDEARGLLDLVAREKVRVFYAQSPVEFGMTEGAD